MRTLYRGHHFTSADLFRPPKPSFLSTTTNVKFGISRVRKCGSRFKHRSLRIQASDEDSFSMLPFDDFGENEYAAGYMTSSSDGDDSDGDYILNPVSDVDLPSGSTSSNDALTITAHRFGMIAKGRRKHRITLGMLNNLVLIVFLIVLLLFVDWCAWKIVRLPLDSFYLSRPFFISIALVSVAGYICVPFLTALKIHQIRRIQRPIKHSKKKSTPTIGGIFFIPVGVGVAKAVAGSSVEVSGAVAVTVAFAAIGLLHDVLCFSKKNTSGLPTWIKLLLEIAVGTLFASWLGATRITTPYSIKMLVPLPRPLGLVCIGKFYLVLTALCFVGMGSGIHLADGPDGLAGGTAALAFVGMSIAVLPICSELAVFGASMAGACVGFLLHNRYKASVFMGDTGSLALGGALAAMAACTGMFFPLFISSGIFFLEASSIVMQIVFYTATRHLTGAGRRMFRMAPFHHHLELCGLREPIIVAGAYVASCLLALVAGYVGLISA